MPLIIPCALVRLPNLWAFLARLGETHLEGCKKSLRRFVQWVGHVAVEVDRLNSSDGSYLAGVITRTIDEHRVPNGGERALGCGIQPAHCVGLCKACNDLAAVQRLPQPKEQALIFGVAVIVERLVELSAVGVGFEDVDDLDCCGCVYGIG